MAVVTFSLPWPLLLQHLGEGVISVKVPTQLILLFSVITPSISPAVEDIILKVEPGAALYCVAKLYWGLDLSLFSFA